MYFSNQLLQGSILPGDLQGCGAFLPQRLERRVGSVPFFEQACQCLISINHSQASFPDFFFFFCAQNVLLVLARFAGLPPLLPTLLPPSPPPLRSPERTPRLAHRYVATAMSVACQVNWASNFVVGIGWPYMNEAMGPYSFVTFGSLLLMTFLFTWQYLPETAGRSHAEVNRAANEPRRRWGGLFGGPSASAVVSSINNDGRMAGAGAPGGGEPSQPSGMEYVVVEGVDLSLA